MRSDLKIVVLLVLVVPIFEISAHNRGIKNENGNDCFMNASTQALSHMVEFRDAYQKIKDGGVLSTPLKTFFEYINKLPLKKGEKYTVLTGSKNFRSYWTNPKNFPEVARSKLKDLQGTVEATLPGLKSGQRDAQEFISAIFDVLDFYFNNLGLNINPIRFTKFESKTLLVGDECKHTSSKKDPTSLLALEIPKKKNIDIWDCLNNFSADETLAGDSQWSCEKCSVLVDAKKHIKISLLPENLIIYLKRFETSNLNKKKDDAVKFPSELILDKNSSILDEDISKKLGDEKIKYLLFAFVCHTGGPKGGHYRAYGKSIDEYDKGDWYHYNDSSISQVSKKNLDRILEQKDENGTPYFLFYKLDDASRAVLIDLGVLWTESHVFNSESRPDLQSKLGKLKTSSIELRGKLDTLKTRLETLRKLLHEKKEELVTEENVWAKITELIKISKDDNLRLTPDIINDLRVFDNRYGSLKNSLTDVRKNIVSDSTYFDGIPLDNYKHGISFDVREIGEYANRAVMLFKRFCEKIGPVILDKNSTYNDVCSNITKLKQHYKPVDDFLIKKGLTSIRDIYATKLERLKNLTNLSDEIKIAMFKRLQEIFFHLYKGYQFKQTPAGVIIDILAEPPKFPENKAKLINVFALEFNSAFKEVHDLFTKSFKILNYKFEHQHNIDQLDLGGIRRIAISDLASCYNSNQEKNGFDSLNTLNAFPKLIWFLLANIFNPSSDSLLIRSWNTDSYEIHFDGFSALINLPCSFWGLLLSQASVDMSDEDAGKVFAELGIGGATIDTLIDIFGSDDENDAIKHLNRYTKLPTDEIQKLTGSFDQKVKRVLSLFLNSKYKIDKIKKDFFKDDQLGALRGSAGIEEDSLLSTGSYLEDEAVKGYLNNGTVQFLLMRRFIRELSAQHLFDIFNKAPTAEEIKEIIINGVKQNRNSLGGGDFTGYFPQELVEAIGNNTVSERFIRDLLAQKERNLQLNPLDELLKNKVLRLKAIVWTLNFIDENAGDEADKIDNRVGFIKFVSGQLRPAYILVTMQAGWHQNADSLETHTCFLETSIPRSLLERNDYDLFKTAIVGIIK